MEQVFLRRRPFLVDVVFQIPDLIYNRSIFMFRTCISNRKVVIRNSGSVPTEQMAPPAASGRDLALSTTRLGRTDSYGGTNAGGVSRLRKFLVNQPSQWGSCPERNRIQRFIERQLQRGNCIQRLATFLRAAQEAK